MKVYCVYHQLGASLFRASSPEAALKRARNRFGSHAAPYYLPEDQEEAITSAEAMGAGVQ